VGDAIALAMASRFGIGAYFHFAVEDREVDTVYMGMYPRRVFETDRLFDEELVRNQDDELNYRLRKSGGSISSPAHALALSESSDLKTLWRQFFQYGMWKIRVLQKHPRQMSPRQFVPPLFVLVVISTVLAVPWLRPARWLLLAALGAYATALLAAAGTVARQHGWRHLPRVLVGLCHRCI